MEEKYKWCVLRKNINCRNCVAHFYFFWSMNLCSSWKTKVEIYFCCISVVTEMCKGACGDKSRGGITWTLYGITWRAFWELSIKLSNVTINIAILVSYIYIYICFFFLSFLVKYNVLLSLKLFIVFGYRSYLQLINMVLYIGFIQ